MGLAMTGWLAGKHIWIEGSSPAIAAACRAAGATLTSDGDLDVWVHVVAVGAAKPAHEIAHAEWRASLGAGLDRRFLGAKSFADACRARGVGGAVLFVGAPEQALGADQAAAQAAMQQPENRRFQALAGVLGLKTFFAARGMSETEIDQCLANPAAVNRWAESTQRNGTEFEVAGTPTFLINGESIGTVTWTEMAEKLRAAGAR